MSKTLLGWAACVGIVLALGSATARADLRLGQLVANVGEVRGGTALSQRFAFTNEGPGAVVVNEVRASCGCLKPRLEPAGTTLPHTYQAGEQGTLLLEVNTLGQAPGKHTWRLTVCYRAEGQHYEIELQVWGSIITEVTVQPANLTLFTDSAVGYELLVTDLRQRPLTVTAVRSSSPQVTGLLADQFQDGQGHVVRRIKLEVGADCPEGTHHEILDIVTDDPLYRELRVPMTVVKRGRQRITAAPGALTLRAIAGGEIPSQLIRVRDRDDEAVHVEQVIADDPAIVCQWAHGPANLATVKVRIDRTHRAADSLRSAVHIQIDRPVRATLTIPVTCNRE